MRTKYLLTLLLMIFCCIAKGQNPSGLPLPNAPYSYYNIGWEKNDSGLIFSNRQPNFTPKFPFTVVGYLNPGVDTGIWWNTGQTWYEIPKVGGGGGGIILTTIGNSGPSTLVANTLNIPVYSGLTGGGGLSPLFTNGVSGNTLTFTLSNAAAGSVFMNNSGGPAAPSFSVPNISTLNGWASGSIALLASTQTFTGANTFSNTVSLSGVIFPTDATYSFGTPTVGASTYYGRFLASNSTLSIESGSSSPIDFFTNGGGGSVMILQSNGQAQLSKYITGTSFTGTPTSALEVDGSGNIIQGSVTGGAGSCINCNISYNAAGQITLAANGSGGGGTQNLTYTQLALDNTLSISGGNTQTFLVATHVLAGLIDSGHYSTLDSLRLRTYTWPTFPIYAVEGTSPIGTHGDSVQFGGSLGAFFQPDSLYTNAQPFYIYGLPDTVATNSSDSVLILNWQHQMKLVAASSIGGVTSVTDNGGGTLTISPNTGSVLAGINLGHANTWTAAQTLTNVGLLFTNNANAGNTIGNGTNNAISINSHQYLSNNNMAFGIGSAFSYTWNINNLPVSSILSTGQWQWNSYLLTSSFPVTAVGMLVFDASGNIGTQAISGGGSVTINGTTGSVSGSTLSFAVSSNVANTAMTISGSGTTLTFINNPAVDFGDNSRAANLNYFWAGGNTTLTGQHNQGMGGQVMPGITSGNYNTGSGFQSLNALTTGSQNTMYGWVTGFSLTTGSFNTFLGSGAGSGDTLGSYNVYVGQITGDLNGQGNYNTVIGTQGMGAEHGAPLWNTIGGAYNTANWTGTDTAVTSWGAYNDLNNLAARKYVIEMGHHINYAGNFGASEVIEIGDSINGGNGTAGFLYNVTAIGHNLLIWTNNIAYLGTKTQAIQLGDSGVQHYSQLATTYPTGGGYLAFVRDSGYYFVYNNVDAVWEGIPSSLHTPTFTLTTTGSGAATYSGGVLNIPTASGGSGVTTIGAYNGGTANSNGLYISGVNLYAQSASTTNPGMINASGAQTLGITMTLNHDAVINGVTVGIGASSGAQNTMVGNGASFTASTGSGNTGLGFDVLYNTNGAANDNTALGAYSMVNVTSGGGNTAVGWHSMYYVTTGIDNTNVGVTSNYGSNPSTASYTASLGYQTLAVNTGNYNTAFGYTALAANTTATYNSAFGANNMANVTTGGYNVAFGATGAATLTTGSYNVLFGNYIDVPTASTSNYGSYDNVLIFRGLPTLFGASHTPVVGQVGIGVDPSGSGATLDVAAGTTSQGQLLLNSSTLLTTPINGMIEGTSSHVYYTAGGTRYNLDQQTLQQVLTAGSTLTGTNSVALGSGSLLFTGASSTVAFAGLTEVNLVVGFSSSPSISAGAGAGTSPTVSVTGTNTDGVVTVSIGTLPSGSSAAIVTITLAGSTTAPNGLIVTLTPYDATTALLTGATMVYARNTAGSATTSWSIYSGTTALTPSTAYNWQYHCVGY